MPNKNEYIIFKCVIRKYEFESYISTYEAIS